MKQKPHYNITSRFENLKKYCIYGQICLTKNKLVLDFQKVWMEYYSIDKTIFDNFSEHYQI